LEGRECNAGRNDYRSKVDLRSGFKLADEVREDGRE